jgi:hypothetical protein
MLIYKILKSFDLIYEDPVLALLLPHLLPFLLEHNFDLCSLLDFLLPQVFKGICLLLLLEVGLLVFFKLLPGLFKLLSEVLDLKVLGVLVL